MEGETEVIDYDLKGIKTYPEKVLSDLGSGREKCEKCKKGIKLFCYGCYLPAPSLADSIPKLDLPLHLHV
ncbi:hypothetical protein AYI70_g5110 [Smittium culicis]|uniref:tRNA-uridine aminocarboxypropyltransferase n=1 Tax=Smittium culicis TaxID=133412 RepID=A0A1R1XW47_9FUNG|nr:hypothetical protein AYI70_g6054 [Smittium culicis]OMJ18844.1 hypothetical protein AYI70_g5110 [Smittium culicis]